MSVKCLTICVIISLAALSPQIIELAHAQEDRWRAGYYFYGYETYPGAGVLGDIFTIDPAVSDWDFCAEWVTIILQYFPVLYWLQAGYVKGWDTGFALRYYFEWRDSYWHHIEYGDSPSLGTWHTYYITHPIEYGESENEQFWFFNIDHSWQDGEIIGYPCYAVDEQAFVETTWPYIIIDGSHFKRLSTFTEDKYWHWSRWDTHWPRADGLYSVTSFSHYEFYANGGE